MFDKSALAVWEVAPNKLTPRRRNKGTTPNIGLWQSGLLGRTATSLNVSGKRKEMQKRPEPPKGGFHQSRDIAEVVVWILHENGKEGEWVSLNEPLKGFGITHPAELERALKYLIEEPNASVSADPDPRAKKYGEWSKEKKIAVITTEVRARLTRRGLEEMHRQKKLSSTTDRKTLRVRHILLGIGIIGLGITVWKELIRPSKGEEEHAPRESPLISNPDTIQARQKSAGLPARTGHDTLKASPSHGDSSHTTPTTTEKKKNASR